jgi:MFS family permease
LRALQGSGAISAVLMAFLADFVAEDQRSKANAFVGMQIGLAFMLSLLSQINNQMEFVTVLVLNRKYQLPSQSNKVLCSCIAWRTLRTLEIS